MQELCPTSPPISQSSTPRPRSSNTNKEEPLSSSVVVTHDQPSPPDQRVKMGEGEDQDPEEEEDPIDALRGCNQPFFMSSPLQTQSRGGGGEEGELPSSFSIDPGGGGRIDLRGLDPLSSTSLWNSSPIEARSGDWREIGNRREERFDRFQESREAGGGGIVELVFTLENKLNFLSETVQDLQIRLRYFEQSFVERDRQIEQLQRTVQTLQSQRPPPTVQPPHHLSQYFANRPLSSSSSSDPYTVSGMTSPPHGNVYDFGSTPPFNEINPSSSLSHRRTLSTPIRTTAAEYLAPTYSSTDRQQQQQQQQYLQHNYAQQQNELARAYPPLNPITSSSRLQTISPGASSSSSSTLLYEPRLATTPTPTPPPVPTIFSRRSGAANPSLFATATGGGGGGGSLVDHPSSEHRRAPLASHSRNTSTDTSGVGGGIWSPISSQSSFSSGSTSLLSPSTSRSSMEFRGGGEEFGEVQIGLGGGTSSSSSSSMFRPLRGGPEDGYNYRGLLENDNEIDEDIFVRRVFLQNDQQCSLFLQQRVKQTSTNEKKFRLLESVGRNLLELSSSKFGNFLVSRCIETADQNMINDYSLKFSNHFLELSLDPFGCHVVQKLLDRCDSSTRERVIDELSPFPNTLLQKPSLHVWNRLLSQPNPPTFYQNLAETGKTSWSRIVLEEGGSLIVQHLLEDWSQDVHGSIVARELLQGLEHVATSACGSFVLVAFIDRNFLPFRTRILELATKLSIDTFGAKLVERVLKLSPAKSITVSTNNNNNNNNNTTTNSSGGTPCSELLSSFIDEITSSSAEEANQEGGGSSSPPLLLTIASHQSGSNLLYHLITSASGTSSIIGAGGLNFKDKGKLIKCISNYRKRLSEEGGVHAQRLLGLIGNGVVVTGGGGKV